MSLWFRRRWALAVSAGFFVIMAAAFFLIFDGMHSARSSASSDQSLDRKPAGKLLVDAETQETAVMPMTFDFVRSPDNLAADGKGRFLLAVNSGYGLMFNSKSKAQQTVAVIDLNKQPEPQVVQTLYFPSPQSANFGLVFDKTEQAGGRTNLYLSGGFENKIWILSFDPKADKPLSPGNNRDKMLEAPFIDVTAFAENAPSPNYNDETAAVYPTGLDLSPDGRTLYVANNLGDTLGIVSDLRDTRKISRVKLRRAGSAQFVYPYDVKVLPGRDGKTAGLIYVSLWGDDSVAVVDGKTLRVRTHIKTGRHPTKLLFNSKKTRLYAVNSDGDSISVIDTSRDASNIAEPIINIKLADNAGPGISPQGLALSENEQTLYIANAKANAVAVVELAKFPLGPNRPETAQRSKLSGLIPTGSYPSAVALAGGKLFIANGKGTGMENSSVNVAETGLYPNMPNAEFPGERYNKRGIYSGAAVSGNISVVEKPSERELFGFTQDVMRSNGLIGRKEARIFPGGRSPFKHVIYIIRENRTYDQVFGDLEKAGNGENADGDASVAIFGAGEAARSPAGALQNITPNARALALRFGLMDRFFVNAEASPDGHNWSTAAFSSDYVDKAFRWNYSGRGRTYDYEGFNRLPSFNPPSGQPPVALPSVFDLPADEQDIAEFLQRYVPYLHGARDVSEPETLYLWDLARRNKLTYRNYGEFVATVSAADVSEVNTRKPKTYPDLSETLTAFATKKSLEGNFSPSHRNYDMLTPDSMTADSYRAAKESGNRTDPVISYENNEEKFRGSSRYGEWVKEFRGYVEDLKSGKGDSLPNLSIVRFSNDHTAGINRNLPTPQFYVAENDYAIGLLAEEVSKSPYWKDTAIFIVEDDAQDGPDHVDAHRSPAFVISAFNRRGALIHEFHNTVSLIRTLELCLNLPPMNLLDANAVPIDIFGAEADLTPFQAVLPEVAMDNLFPPQRPDRAMIEYMRLTDKQDLAHADMANPRELNQIIWYSVRGDSMPMPGLARLPAFDLMTAGIKFDDDDDDATDDD